MMGIYLLAYIVLLSCSRTTCLRNERLLGHMIAPLFGAETCSFLGLAGAMMSKSIPFQSSKFLTKCFGNHGRVFDPSVVLELL